MTDIPATRTLGHKRNPACSRHFSFSFYPGRVIFNLMNLRAATSLTVLSCLLTAVPYAQVSTLETEEAEEPPHQYPAALKRSFFGLSAGLIHYPFSAEQLEPGISVESVQRPPATVRLTLYGYRISRHFSAQLTYMRPVQWVRYKNLNGNSVEKTVWMNIAGLTLAGEKQLFRRWHISAEAGWGLVTRKGFSVDNRLALRDAVNHSFMGGAALRYRLHPSWDLQLQVAAVPAHSSSRQPAIFFGGIGFQYRAQPLDKQVLREKKRAGLFFPREQFVLGYTTNRWGYGVNDFFSRKFPVFWGGAAHIREGFSFYYQRNIFHTKKVFAFDWGAGGGYWVSRNLGERVFSFSVFPVLRFFFWRPAGADLFAEYSVAGPAFLSRSLIDRETTGRRFTFQDFMGIGFYAGKSRSIGGAFRIAHFSNGNIFPQNDGVKVPLSVNLLWNTGRRGDR